jgi:hypothetical protein
MRALFIAGATISVLLAVALIRIGLRQWRNEGRPLSYWFRSGPMDAESRAGYDRGGLVLGIMVAFFAIVLGEGAIIGAPRHGQAVAWIVIGTAAVAGLVICVGLFTSIMYFNWPRFLVPPHLRDQPGAIAGRRHRRREHLPMM